jgi:hypothetical protein
MGYSERGGILVPDTWAERGQEVGAMLANVQLLTERLAELELALEDQGWMRLSQEGQREFSRAALRKITQLARLFYLKNPLIRRGVNVQANYVFGQGVEIRSDNEDVNTILQSWQDDAKNQAELTTQQAHLQTEVELQVMANLFFVFFVDARKRGRVRVRTIPFDQVEDVIADPEDAKTPWFYKRVWTEARLDPALGQIMGANRTEYYPDWRYRPAQQPATIGDSPVRWESPVYHIKVGGLSDMRFGVSEVYAALDWAKAYTQFLENWATIVRSYASFAWQLTTKAGKAGVAAAKTKLGSTYGTGLSGGETNPPPIPGSTFIGADSVNMQPIRTAGATTSAEDGRRLLLMVASTMGLPETFFGDTSVGTLATAKSLDRPTELQMRQRQMLWQDILGNIARYVVEQAVRAGTLAGTVVEEDDGTPIVTLPTNDETGEPASLDIHVTFPPILERDITESVAAIVDAATLGGQGLAGTLDLEMVTRMLLGALGEQNADDLLAKLFPPPAEGEEEVPMWKREELAPPPPPAPVLVPAVGQPGQGAEVEEDQLQQESFGEALREFRDAVRGISG